MPERQVLICTVGTSLFSGNLERLPFERDNPPNWENLKRTYQEKNWRALARELACLPPDSRVCGAEINTIHELITQKGLPLRAIHFLVSDTPAGEETGKVLQYYFKNHSSHHFSVVEYHRIEKLQDQHPQDFKVYGLRNLAREIGTIIQRIGGPEKVLIDATGGYKAQIAIGLLIGQVLNIPVMYKHERFSQIIDFPPLPVSFDYSLFGTYAGLLHYLEKGIVTVDSEELDLTEEDEKLRVLLEETDVGNRRLFALSPIGQIYLLGYRLHHQREVTELASAQNKEVPHFSDDHYPEGFKDYVKKIWREVPWIVTIKSLPYYQQRSIKGRGFTVREIEGQLRLVGTYRDRNDFGARFEIIPTDTSREALIYAVELLNERYGD
ncbi:putative CRISPR-associated protein [Treponema sp. J25]|uniref:putative CRISPR-associated protein n=1 Tax=Treponema sp. J25 TaxID=2094121 RepID=UPI00140560BA|nr:putative CRISPR-associated protein [Treponema sp. J25]